MLERCMQEVEVKIKSMIQLLGLGSDESASKMLKTKLHPVLQSFTSLAFKFETQSFEELSNRL